MLVRERWGQPLLDEERMAAAGGYAGRVGAVESN